MADGYLRIGEFSDRVGVSPDLLRAWERRYGLLRPDRSTGGFRLYSDADIARVERALALVDQGLSTAEAARLALADVEVETPQPAAPPPPPGDGQPMAALAEQLTTALGTYDEAAVHRTLDELLAVFSMEAVLREVVLAELARIGGRWAAGELSVAQEHFASNLLRGRLLAMARGWGLGTGPMAVLAAPPGEEHDLSLVVFGLALWRRGWRITFLGSDTPISSLRDAITAVDPALLVLATVDADRFRAVERELSELRAHVKLAVGGAGASAEFADAVGALHLEQDPVTAAHVVADSFGPASGPRTSSHPRA